MAVPDSNGHRGRFNEGDAAPEAKLPAGRETLTRTVEWVDTDAGGHHHNSFVLRSVEAAEARLLHRLGLKDCFSISPRVRQEVDFRAKLYFGQEITVILEIEAVGCASMTFRFEVWGEAFDDSPLGPVTRRLAASGRIVTVHVPRGMEKSVPWPAEAREALTSAMIA